MTTDELWHLHDTLRKLAEIALDAGKGDLSSGLDDWATEIREEINRAD